jgi:hypothetical protein
MKYLVAVQFENCHSYTGCGNLLSPNFFHHTFPVPSSQTYTNVADKIARQ